MISTKYLVFQSDLHQMSLNDALKKNDLSLREAFQTLHHPTSQNPSPRKKRDYKNRYLLFTNKSIYIRKKIDDKYHSFGCYNSVQSARKVRNYLEEHDWECSDLDSLCDELGVVRRKVGKRKKT